MKLSWEVDGVEITVGKLEDGLEAGMEDAVDKILEQLERKAKDRIAVRPYIFTGQVYESFTDQTSTADSSSGISSRFINSAKHAGALEHGVHASKYADGAPPVSALMPWVIAKLGDWTIDPEAGGGGSAVQTPIAGGDEITTNDPTDVGYTADWTPFHKHGFSEDEMWENQDVALYNGTQQSYVSATVTSINPNQEIVVTDGDGNSYLINPTDNISPQGFEIAAGESWRSLTESEQRDIAREMIESITIDDTFSQDERDSILSVLSQYADLTKDPTELKKLATIVSKINKNDSMSARGSWQGDLFGGTVVFNSNKFTKDTIRHEFGHAYFSGVLETEYVEGARFGDWDSVDKFKRGKILWEYDSRGPDYGETQPGDDYPHPSTYMGYDADTRDGVGIYDDVDHEAFDLWNEYIRISTKYELQERDGSGVNPSNPPNYDPFYGVFATLNPDNGAAREGGFMHVRYDDGDRRAEYHVKLLSSVYTDNDGQNRIDVLMSGQGKSLKITERGRFERDSLSFEGYAPPGAVDSGEETIKPDDVPDDPGFYADSDDIDELFREAINRELWREMIATEVGDTMNIGSYVLRGDEYSSINAHEVIAHLMAIIFSGDDLGNSDAAKLEDLLERSPELVYMVNQKFGFSDEMVTELERRTGLSFEDLMYDIWREHIK